MLKPLLCLAVFTAPAQGQDETPLLGQAYADDFYLGATVGKPVFVEPGQPTLELVERHFNSVSPENELKWQPYNPKPDVYRTAQADAFVDFGNERDMYVVGHALFWHEQTPKWVFQGEDGQPVERAVLLERMRQRVQHLNARYGGKIDAWDVVNESIEWNGKLRKSPWTQIIGDDFILEAFAIAQDVLPASTELLYNDYSMTAGRKRDAVVKLIQELKQNGIRIDGVGMQGHWQLENPALEEIEASIIAFHEAGVDVHITELDIDVLPREKGMFDADINQRLAQDPSMDPYRDGLPDDIQQKLAQRYADIFELFLKHKDKIKRVTFWGTTDKYSWLNNWPMKGRTNHPLLFDRERQPKPAFYTLLGLKESTEQSRLDSEK